MKKILLVCLVSVAALIGCSETDDLQVENPLEEEVIPEEELYSNVPFTFIASLPPDTGYVTRGTNEGKTIDNFGLFCLAKYAINDGVTENRNPSWSGKAKAVINQHSIWKKNVPISVLYTSKTGVRVLWDNPMNSDYYPYYPDKDWFAYGFVAYHPRTENIVYTQTSITAYIKLDGRDKVMYSMTKGPKDPLNDESMNQKAFSKTYFDYVNPQSGAEEYVYPYFSFQTLTSTLNFYFYSKGEPVNNLHIDKVEFDDFPCIMYLGLAKLLRTASKKAYDMKSSIAQKPFILNEDKFNDNNLSQFEELAGGPFGHFELYEDNGEPISGKKNADGSYEYTLTTERKKVGGSIYIPPVYSGHSREALKIYITVADDAGNTYKSQSPVVVKTKSGWKQATSYDIPIWLNNPSQVAKDASLAEWVAADPIEVNATLTNWVQQP